MGKRRTGNWEEKKKKGKYREDSQKIRKKQEKFGKDSKKDIYKLKTKFFLNLSFYF